MVETPGTQHVRAAEHRLQALIAAQDSIIGDLELSVVLRNIVEAARRLSGARYAALGVLAPGNRSLEQFITVGLDDQTRAEIGHLPTGKGLLGALIDDPHPIRLADMAGDPRSAGFPAHHPPMTSFLGVPVRVRGEVYGNLYLTDSTDGAFSAEDEEVVSALATTAGIAIENARLFTQGEQRQRWLAASALVTRQLLAVEGEDPLVLIARQARELADADLVTVVLPSPDPRLLVVEVAAGRDHVDLAGMTYARDDSFIGDVLDTGRPARLTDLSRHPMWHQAALLPTGPTMIVPLAGATGPRGALALGRTAGSPPFDDADLTMASAFANQAALALELADIRSDQLRIRVLEDRERIARDLHDLVIQRLYAAGLSVQSAVARCNDPALATRLDTVIGDIDATIAQIRTAVFELQSPRPSAEASAQRQVLDVVGEVSPLLANPPAVRFSGPVDAVLTDAVLEDLLATLREALTNVAKHARADHAEVDLRVTADTAVLVIADDGVGLGLATRRSGLANLRVRAEQHGGTLEVTTNDRPGRDGVGTGGGTRLTWSIKLT